MLIQALLGCQMELQRLFQDVGAVALGIKSSQLAKDIADFLEFEESMTQFDRLIEENGEQ